jgi:2-dehydro-3-deoxygluconokinase
VVVTLGAEGALAYERTGDRVQRHGVFPTEVQERIGAGDAFAAGFLHGWLGRGGDAAEDADDGGAACAHGLACGNALAALKQTWLGDAVWATAEELEALLATGPGDPRRVER